MPRKASLLVTLFHVSFLFVAQKYSAYSKVYPAQ
jgi:hypothetical protein